MELLNNIGKIHTTKMGLERIKKNTGIIDPVFWCTKNTEKASIERKGKNYYVEYEGIILTINAYSFTIITAHKAIKK